MNTRKRIAVALLAISGFTLSACGEPVVGTVIGKEYDDADTVRSTRQDCTTTTTGTGTTKTTKRTCKTVPTTKHERAEWELTVQTDGGDVREVEISESAWKRVNVGDRFDEKAQR